MREIHIEFLSGITAVRMRFSTRILLLNRLCVVLKTGNKGLKRRGNACGQARWNRFDSLHVFKMAAVQWSALL